MLVVEFAPLAELAMIAVLFLSGLLTGASRTPRDVMVKEVAPPGQIGRVFGFAPVRVEQLADVVEGLLLFDALDVLAHSCS